MPVSYRPETKASSMPRQRNATKYLCVRRAHLEVYAKAMLLFSGVVAPTLDAGLKSIASHACESERLHRRAGACEEVQGCKIIMWRSSLESCLGFVGGVWINIGQV